MTKYEKGLTKNVFQQLDAECSLCVLSLCLAANDMVCNHTLMDNSEDEEASYHFPVSLSILREVAKIITKIEKLPSLKMHFSQETERLLQPLKEHLFPFQDGSLTNGTLRPIRDLTFHYDLSKIDGERINPLLAEIKNEPELKVRASSGDNSILRYRYVFADAFRSKLVDSYLTKEWVVKQISVAAVDVSAFTDSLLCDLAS